MAKKKESKSWFSTVNGFSWAVLATTLVLIVLFCILVFVYDPSDDRAFGIPDGLFAFVVASHLPVVVATGIGYRDVVFSFVAIGKPREAKPVEIHAGLGTLYLFSLAGPAMAAAVLLVVASGVDEEKAKTWLGLAAAAWGATTGEVFRRFFNRYARAGDKAAESGHE